MAGINLARCVSGEPIVVPPATTMLGGLYRYLREADPKHFQPMNANFGLLDPLPGKVKKDRKKELLVERAQSDFGSWMDRVGIGALTQGSSA
jgi:methylenetetrahydrofolate--tRNA-(uracil-5-)-methyltransferase